MPATINKRHFTTWEDFIQTKVKTLHCWLNYAAGVGRKDIVKEDSIKYGIAEFFSINCNPFTLEDYHNSLTPNRHIDLTFKVHIGADVVFNVCEFKLITENTYSTGETNRYFADLCRLGLYQKNHNNPNSLKTYFLVAGKTEDAYPLLPPPSNGFNQLQIQQGNNHNNTPIKDWLSFDCNNPDKTFTLSKYPQFKAFNKDYKKDKTAAATGGIKWLRGNQKFTTRLVHIEGTDIGEGGFLVAVWEIITSAEGNAK